MKITHFDNPIFVWRPSPRNPSKYLHVPYTLETRIIDLHFSDDCLGLSSLFYYYFVLFNNCTVIKSCFSLQFNTHVAIILRCSEHKFIYYLTAIVWERNSHYTVAIFPNPKPSQNPGLVAFQTQNPGLESLFGTHRKRVCDFLLVRHSKLGLILHHFGDITGFCSWLHLYSTQFWGCSSCTRSPILGSM